MSKSIRVVTLAVALVFVLASVAAAAPASDTVIVKFKDGTSAGQRSDALDGADAGRTVGTVPGIGARVVRAEDSATATAAALADDPAVEYAEVNRRMHAAVVPNDPLFARQWALQVINAPTAWDARALAGFPVRRRARRRHRRLRRAHDAPGSPGRDRRLPVRQHDRRGLERRRRRLRGPERSRDQRHRHDRQPRRQRRRDRRPGLQLDGDHVQGARRQQRRPHVRHLGLHRRAARPGRPDHQPQPGRASVRHALPRDRVRLRRRATGRSSSPRRATTARRT